MLNKSSYWDLESIDKSFPYSFQEEQYFSLSTVQAVRLDIPRRMFTSLCCQLLYSSPETFDGQLLKTAGPTMVPSPLSIFPLG